jgi:hypothetical protein
MSVRVTMGTRILVPDAGIFEHLPEAGQVGGSPVLHGMDALRAPPHRNRHVEGVFMNAGGRRAVRPWSEDQLLGALEPNRSRP